MPYQLLLIERDDTIATVTLNRAEKRNALNTQLRDEISAAFGELEADGGVSVAVLTGAGPVFCAGFDTKEFETTPPAEIFSGESSRRYHHRVQHFAKPLVAAVNGYAVGIGCIVTYCCDLIVASERAEWRLPQVALGILPAQGGTVRLARWVGRGQAMKLAMGFPLKAEEAYRIGLVSAVVPGERLLEEAKAFARTIAEAPADTLRGVKSSILEATAWKFQP